MAKNVRRIKKRDETQGITVQTAIKDYLVCAHVKKLASTTRSDYEMELGFFGRWCSSHSWQKKRAVLLTDDCEPIMLHQVDDELVHEYLEYRKATYKPAKRGNTEISTYTLAGIVTVIKTFLNWCVLDEQYCKYVQAIVVSRIEKPQIIEVITETFSNEQIEALFKACDNEESEHLQMRDRAILAVLLGTGIRATELCTLMIGNISLDSKDAYVRIFGKGSRWGEVGFGEKARRALKKYIETFREPTVEYEVQQQNSNLPTRQFTKLVQQQMKQALVFVNRNGDPLTKSGLYRMMKRLEDWSGIEISKCSPHVWRHTFSRLFMENGGSIYELSKLLRHKNLETTELYLKSLGINFARKNSVVVLDRIADTIP